MPKPAPDHYLHVKAHLPHVEPGQAIGLLGGSFNPPHAAHRMISETALKRLGLDKVWWIVTPGNPLKRHSELAPIGERLRLCRALANTRRIEVTDFETDLPSAYTYSTLAFLRSRNPLVRFVWIMGADNLAEMEKWHRWREIFGLFPIAVVDRPGWRLKALASKPARAYAGRRLPEADAKMLAHTPPPAWTFLTGPLSTLSSTALRAKAKRRNEVVAKKAQPGELPWRRLRNGAAAAPEPEPTQQAEHVRETAPVQGS
jgi:nicotinate-nucleotide adenylyltransferase